MTTSALTPQQRLAASRQAIIRDMDRDDTEPAFDADEHGESDISEAGVDASSSSWDLVKQVGRSWWQSHPANLAFDIARPMMQNYAEDKPFRLLGIAAGAGVAIMVLRPWRLISLTGVALALLKSTEVSGVVRSLLHGERPAHPRR